jgi:hypothetical protein
LFSLPAPVENEQPDVGERQHDESRRSGLERTSATETVDLRTFRSLEIRLNQEIVMNPLPSVSAGGLCLLLMAGARLAAADEPKQDALTAKQVLDRMAKVYAGCKSYRDSGLVKTVFVQVDGKHTVEKPFTTAFICPDRFRFEYKWKDGDRPEARYIV